MCNGRTYYEYATLNSVCFKRLPDEIFCVKPYNHTWQLMTISTTSSKRNVIPEHLHLHHKRRKHQERDQ